MTNERWLALPYADWKDTYGTLHMWTQVVGKIAVRHAAPENHSWGIAMQVTPRGLATRTLFHGATPFSFEFDFLAHQLGLKLPGDTSATLDLKPMTVASFYAEVMRLCADAGLPVQIWTMPVEIQPPAVPVRFDQDTEHQSYDEAAVERFWRVLSQADRVFRRHRESFVGKCSPVHFFWGSFDLAVTRFSGHQAPPRSPEEPAFMSEAYTHEVISHGFWPGNEQLPEAIFYSYAAPVPPGLSTARVSPDAAYYLDAMGEFVLPYEAVRTAADPERAILDFMNSTYEQAAALAHWDRASLERPGKTA
ncbi:MAG: hypothetical protein H0W08_27000 [Acidobacteria bacterium]|nr:hypothetical protein [Acidobacteriota bacterium]